MRQIFVSELTWIALHVGLDGANALTPCDERFNEINADSTNIYQISSSNRKKRKWKILGAGVISWALSWPAQS